MGLALVLFGCFALYWVGRVTVLTCRGVEPTQVDCTSQVGLLGVLPLGQKRVISGVQGAKIDWLWSDPETCRVTLESSEGPVSLMLGMYDEDAHKVAGRVNHFIDDAETGSLTIRLVNWPLILSTLSCGMLAALFLGSLFLLIRLGASVRRLVGGRG